MKFEQFLMEIFIFIIMMMNGFVCSPQCEYLCIISNESSLRKHLFFYALYHEMP